MQDLPFQTLTQLTGLVLTLVAGWAFGLASSSAGRKWRDKAHDDAIEHARYRALVEQELRDANRRIGELEGQTQPGGQLGHSPEEPIRAHQQ